MDMFESSGCDLMKQPGEIANWLVEWQKTLPKSAKVVIGNYTYLDGDLHVKLALCADYVIQRLRKAHPTSPHISPHLPTSPRISPHLPTSPHKATPLLGAQVIKLTYSVTLEVIL